VGYGAGVLLGRAPSQARSRSLNLRDYGAVPDGATDIGPALVAACADCVAYGYRRIIIPGHGAGAGVAAYYSLGSNATIPAMPPVHVAGPVATLTIEGDGYGSVLISTPSAKQLTTLSPLICSGIELEVNLKLSVAGAIGYPHFFNDMEFNGAVVIPTVASLIFFKGGRLAYNGGWAMYSQAAANTHHSVSFNGVELNVAYLAGGAAAYVMDKLSVVGGNQGNIYPFTALVDANGTLPNGASVTGCPPLAERVASGLQLGVGARMTSDAGAPTIAGAVGDRYKRTDTPGTVNQREYICTVAGAAGVATWVGIL
jgi:hypothetical protein